MTTANRGKYAEKRVKTLLTAMESIKCTHHRFPDAHAGSFAVTPCDFMVCKEGRLTLLEVKEVQHSFRLPHKNFGLDQCARMRNWMIAGASAWVLVYFVPEKAWRAVDVIYFMTRTGGSWDMRDLPLVDIGETLNNIT